MNKDIREGRGSTPAGALEIGSPTPQHSDSNPRGAALGRVATTCIEHAYGATFRLSFQIKVF